MAPLELVLSACTATARAGPLEMTRKTPASRKSFKPAPGRVKKPVGHLFPAASYPFAQCAIQAPSEDRRTAYARANGMESVQQLDLIATICGAQTSVNEEDFQRGGWRTSLEKRCNAHLDAVERRGWGRTWKGGAMHTLTYSNKEAEVLFPSKRLVFE
uniref:Putative secreted protein n=1 Tax=Ixodes ricinus TaxID=34613 RepID=A0A6B0UX79_IXORI